MKDSYLEVGVLGKKGRLWNGLLSFHRAINRWRFWPAGVLPLPANPASRHFAFDRGTPIDRYFIVRFLERNAEYIRGRVLEVGDRGYTQTYGGERVAQSDVLHVTSGNPEATIIGDLATGKGLPRGVYDCLVLTQTLHVIYDVHSAVKNIYRLLKPGGVALVTIPGITPISRFDAERWGDFWRMTPEAVQRLFAEAFSPEDVEIEVFGNVRLSVAYLYGLAVEEIPASALSERDPDYPLLICICAKKGTAQPGRSGTRISRKRRITPASPGAPATRGRTRGRARGPARKG
ncbi:MAG: methyltransferase domain-containing protein [Anaerolineales bacterium]